MREHTYFERGEWEREPPGADWFQHAIDVLEQINQYIKVFAENPTSQHGAIKLAQIVKAEDELFNLYGDDNSPFSHHSMERLRQSIDILIAKYHSLKEDSDCGPSSYHIGRAAEQSMQAIEARIEEWEWCRDYAS